MELTFAPKGRIQINDARLIFKNFAGAPSKYNREGDRNFAVVIPNREIADALVNDKNKYGVGWNVIVKEPKDEGDEPLMHLKVKVKFSDRGPKVYLVSGNAVNRLTENTIRRLDNVDILSVNLDIRPYDDEINGKPFRAAYLEAMEVVQNIDRFSARYADEEFPEE